MIIVPTYLKWTQGDDESPGSTVDEVDRYHGISDAELESALDRRFRQMSELGEDPSSATGISVIQEVERIQEELLRRTRARRPSTR